MKRFTTRPKRRAKKRTLSKLNKKMLLSFLASAFSGVALHIAGHSTTHEYWHIWAIAHILTSLLFLIFAIRHVWIYRRLRSSKFLFLIFLGVLLTGIVLLVFIDGVNSFVGMWHYRLGLIFIILTLLHAARKVKMMK